MTLIQKTRGMLLWDDFQPLDKMHYKGTGSSPDDYL